MDSVFERSQEAKNSRNWSYLKWAGALVLAGFAAIFGIARWGFATLEKGCKAGSETLDNWSQEDAQKAQEINDEIKGDLKAWKKEVKKEKVDDDSISITSSEDGEVVELTA